MKYSLTLFLSLLFSSSAVFALAEASKEELFDRAKAGHNVLTYNDARKALFNKIYIKQDAQGYFVTDVYCATRFGLQAGDVTNGRLPDSSTLNTEHTWPQSKFSKLTSASTQKSDLHHLYPAGSKINSDRGNFPFAEVDGSSHISCSSSKRGHSLDGANGTYFEPRDEHKGNVARSMFYFSVRYKIALDQTQEHYLRMWHKEDPIDAAEKATHEEIVKVQGNRNPFIDDPTLVDQISDF